MNQLIEKLLQPYLEGEISSTEVRQLLEAQKLDDQLITTVIHELGIKKQQAINQISNAKTKVVPTTLFLSILLIIGGLILTYFFGSLQLRLPYQWALQFME